MTVEQELQILMNKYGKMEVVSCFKSVLEEEVLNEKKDAWRRLAPRYGLSPNIYNTSFNYKGSVFYLKEIKPKNRKYPIIAERDDGVSFKFTPSLILEFLDGVK